MGIFVVGRVATSVPTGVPQRHYTLYRAPLRPGYMNTTWAKGYTVHLVPSQTDKYGGRYRHFRSGQSGTSVPP